MIVTDPDPDNPALPAYRLLCELEGYGRLAEEILDRDPPRDREGLQMVDRVARTTLADLERAVGDLVEEHDLPRAMANAALGKAARLVAAIEFALVVATKC